MTAIHDPNKSLTPITIYAPARLARQVSVVSVASGDAGAQERQTARTSAVQLTAAASRHAPQLTSGSVERQTDVDNLLSVDSDAEPGWLWLSRIPLRGLLDEESSLARLVLGVTVNPETGQSEIVTGDMARLVHVAIGGSSGWGKSMFLRSLAFQLATAVELPDLALVDLEAVTFAPFAKCDRLLYPIVDTEKDAVAVFDALTDELDRRKALFASYPGVDSLAVYNAKSDNPFVPIICLTDEATALLADKSVESALWTLALRGRKYGLWLCLGGQDWKASSLDTAIRNQLSARVQFKAMSASQSRVLLQTKGAESLNMPGRALAVLPSRGLVEFQAPMIGPNDIMTLLTGDGPRHDFPLPADVTQDELIRKLASEGLSKRKIQERIFGYIGGKAHTEVNRVLGDR